MGRRGRGDCNMGGPGGLQEVTYAVPADKCGLVIGKGNEYVFSTFLRFDLHACWRCQHLGELLWSCFVCVYQNLFVISTYLKVAGNCDYACFYFSH